MSLDGISESIQDITAIKNYPLLQQQVATLEIELKRLGSELEVQKKKFKECEETTTTQKEQAKITGEALTKVRSDLEKANTSAGDHRSRVDELESLMATADGKTLAEVQRAVLEARRKEIDDAASARFQKMKKEWEIGEKASTVQKESVGLLSEILFYLGSHDGSRIGQDVLSSGLVSEVETIINGRARVIAYGAEFKRDVENAADKLLKKLIKTEWPKFLEQIVTPMATQLMSAITTNLVEFLRGDFQLPCKLCGTPATLKLEPDSITILMRGDTLRLTPPSDETCEISGSRHKYSSPTFADLLKAKLVGEYDPYSRPV